MKLYRAICSDELIIEGSLKRIYEAVLWKARNDNVSTKIYDATRQDWSKLNSIPELPVITLTVFKESKLVIVTNQRSGNYVSYPIGSYWK